MTAACTWEHSAEIKVPMPLQTPTSVSAARAVGRLHASFVLVAAVLATPAAAQSLKFTELYTVGEDTKAGPAVFDPVVAVALSTTGQLLVGSRDPARLASFTDGGRFDRWIGRQGDAQGEFRHVTDIATTDDGEIYVLDKLLGRITCYDSEGAYIRHVEIQLDHLGELSFIKHSSGSFVLIGAVRESDELVHVLDENGRYLYSFGQLIEIPDRLAYHAVAREQLLQGKVVEVDEGDLLVVLRAPLKVARFGMDGELQWVVGDDLLPEPFGYLIVSESRYSARFYPSVTSIGYLGDERFAVFTAHFEDEFRHGEIRSSKAGGLLRRWSFPFEAYPWRLDPSGLAVVHIFDPYSRFIVSRWEYLGEPSPTSHLKHLEVNHAKQFSDPSRLGRCHSGLLGHNSAPGRGAGVPEVHDDYGRGGEL